MSDLEMTAKIIEQHSDHSLLQFDRDKLGRLKQIRAIVVVGPSGAGKSTLVDVVRDWVRAHDSEKTFTVPKRVVSRPQRTNDNFVENDFAATPKEFDEKTKGGIRWQRKWT